MRGTIITTYLVFHVWARWGGSCTHIRVCMQPHIQVRGTHQFTHACIHVNTARNTFLHIMPAEGLRAEAAPSSRARTAPPGGRPTDRASSADGDAARGARAAFASGGGPRRRACGWRGLPAYWAKRVQFFLGRIPDGTRVDLGSASTRLGFDPTGSGSSRRL